jgi:uncharacterized membrane protein YkoI
MTHMRRIFAMIAMACGLAGAIPSVTGAAADAQCYPTWSEASGVASSENLMPVERLSQMARARYKGEVVKTTLCRERGRFVYRMVIREARGVFKTVTVDAHRPFER